MAMRFIFLALGTGILCSCATEKNSPIQVKSEDYAIRLPADMQKVERMDQATGFINYDYKTARRKSGDISIEIYSSSINGCKNIGASKVLNIGDENKIWGKVDFFDMYGNDHEGPAPDCRPFVNGSAYVMCSEKNGKQVIICVSQATDNPEMAKQIFESFKWLD